MADAYPMLFAPNRQGRATAPSKPAEIALTTSDVWKPLETQPQAHGLADALSEHADAHVDMGDAPQ
jgi:hypothetical protein